MLDRLDLRNDWSAFGLWVFIGTVVMVLATLLTFVWEFDVRTSPAWQVGVYYLMLVLFLSRSFVVASWRPFPFGEWYAGRRWPSRSFCRWRCSPAAG